MPKRERQLLTGFSLVELLVVIAIVGVLLSISLPSLRAAREAAGRAKCLANLRQVGLSFINYANDHRDWGPGPNAVDNDYGGFIRLGQADVRGYFPNTKILVCPGQDPDWVRRATGAPGTIYQPTGAKLFYFGYRIYFGWGGETNATDVRNLYGWPVTGGTMPKYTETNHTYRVPSANMRFYGRLMTSVNGSTCFVDQPDRQPMSFDVFNPSGGQMHMPGFFVDSNHADESVYGQNMVFADGHGVWKKPEATVRRFQNFDFVYW
jgi:prepilin-type N-terminal cleavage/methylation domain-containing protein